MKDIDRTQQSPQSEQEESESTPAESQELRSTEMQSETSKPNLTSESSGNRRTFLDEVQEVLRIADLELVEKLLAQAADVSQKGGIKQPNDYRYPLALLRAIGPRDQMESILAVQMVGTHSLGMEFLRRASNADSGPVIDAQLARATKLLKLNSAQLETLVRHRSRGEQKMIVEHVHIHRGGQAIVGTVNHESGATSPKTQEEKDQ